ncbi:MAG: ATP-dependent RecD-like DNA helicase [Oscillospiraceae bacterium]|nr:ATP-dependent RecD-like DNA helicase [Oscillospiraceae bacterium]
MSDNQHISGIVEHVIFRNEENGYMVLELNAEGILVTVAGELGEAEEGECLSLWGNYQNHPRYGEQFQAETCERKLPDTSVDIERYLSSGIIKGIRKALARKIVRMFGTDTFRILEQEPQKLMQISGMSQKKCDDIARESRQIFALRNMISYFDSYGMKSKYAVRAYRAWGADCREMLEKNPYLLCTDSVGMDFQKAELYAHALHVPKTSHCRISAGIIYILRHNTLLGHTCLPLDKLAAATVQFLEINETLFYETYQTELENGNLIEFVRNHREFIYLPEYYLAECVITERIGSLRQLSDSDIPADSVSKLIAETEQQAGIQYAEKQKQAIASALSHHMLLMTGGPGTGKTTTLNAMIYCLKEQGQRVLITAPTGRAAKRISDLTGYEAKTIHRLLGVQFESGIQKFIHHENNPLPCDVLMIDEVSMVDVLLFSSLLRALRTDCKLILVGDSDQLPSVGAGSLLKHLLESHCMPVIALKEIFRQAQQSCIITNAHRIINGEMPELSRKDNDFFFFHRTNFSQVSDLVLDLACTRLPQAYHYSPVRDIQIITPTKQGLLGTVALNKVLQARLNPPDAETSQVRSSLYEFRVGDKVMQTKNNYDIIWTKKNNINNTEKGTGIFNGDIGIILEINRRSHEVTIDFDGRMTVYPTSMLEQLELAYAITVHKSQGSEFEAVIMPLLGKMEKLSYRNLFYTAVTRAKKLLILVSTPAKIQQMIETVNQHQRYSNLKYMLWKECHHAKQDLSEIKPENKTASSPVSLSEPLSGM